MIKTHLTLSSSSSAAVSEVSGGTAALPTRWLLLVALSGLGDPPRDHQRETWRPVSHRHSETQETAVRTPPAMTFTSDHSTAQPPPPPSWRLEATHTLSPRQHVISTSHGNQWCTYMLTNTTADEGKRSNHPVCLMIKKITRKPSWGMEKLVSLVELWPLNAAVSKWKPPAGLIGPYCVWISGLHGLLDPADRIQDNPEVKDQISINRLVTQFSFMLCPLL